MKTPQFKRLRKAKPVIQSRITNETVAEHRERILTGGRRFKYPMQYARHRLVINTIGVIIATLIILVTVGWWQLYSAQNTSVFFYRVTRIIPVPIASVDGSSVSYSDYLMYFNSSAHYLQQSEQLNLASEDGKRQIEYVKRKSMDNVIADSYAKSLAKKLNISVKDSRVDQVIDDDRNTTNGRISQETYDASALNILGWSASEYRQDAKSKLIRQDVSYAIDSTAQLMKEKVASLIKEKGGDFDQIVKLAGGEGSKKVTTGISGLVPLTNRDGGLSTVASNLKKDQISGAIKSTSGDGYYFIKLLDRTETQLNYTYLHIPLTEFENRLIALRKDKKIQEYISIPAISDQNITH